MSRWRESNPRRGLTMTKLNHSATPAIQYLLNLVDQHITIICVKNR